MRPYFLPELRRPRLELLLRAELLREREEALERRDDADFVRRCPVLLRPVAERRRDFERVERECDDDELLLRDLDVDLRVAIISSLLHTQTTGHCYGLRSIHKRLYRRTSLYIE